MKDVSIRTIVTITAVVGVKEPIMLALLRESGLREAFVEFPNV